MHRSKLGLCLLSLLAAFGTLAAFSAEDTIQGFEDPAILQRVMGGEIVKDEVTATATEFHTTFRAFFNKVSPDAYVGLATDHAKYPEMFPDLIKEMKTTKVNADHTEWDYWMNAVYKVGIFQVHLYPEGHQVYHRAPDTVSEASLVHTITNYQDMLKSAVETTRLIPYQSGILIYDDVHVVLQKENSESQVIKDQLGKQFERYFTTFRDVLTGGQ